MNYFIDTHAHLNFKAFDKSYLRVAKKAIEQGVEAVIIPGSSLGTSLEAEKRALEINQKLNKKYCFIAWGIHPVHVNELEIFDTFEKNPTPPSLLVAIGEAGLDFYHDRDKKTKDSQMILFNRHIDLSLKLDLPLICHNRLADEEMLELIQGREMPKKVVFHCFSSNWKFAQMVLNMGYYLSFTGNITYGNKSLKKVIERTPLDKILIETDSPYIVPEPLRSQGVKENEPAYVLEVAKKIAQIKGLDLKEVSFATTKNAKEFFGI